MKESVKRVFADRAITLFEILPFSACRVINERKLERLDFSPKSVILFALPYFVGKFQQCNLSYYAVAKDYHLYTQKLATVLESELSRAFEGFRFATFADNSPIDERDAAVKAGLGMRGKNGLVITEDYGTYIFLGEVLTDLAPENLGALDTLFDKSCENCGNCLAACPKKDVCLSSLTQKKGELTAEEEEEILALGSAWGCDVCQSVCPHNQAPKVTPIDFFHEALIPYLDSATLLSMSDADFESRAYSWRGKKTILRNLFLLEKKKKDTE